MLPDINQATINSLKYREGHNGGVLTANILWKIPQRRQTAVDIGRHIEAEHAPMPGGKCHSCCFPLYLRHRFLTVMIGKCMCAFMICLPSFTVCWSRKLFHFHVTIYSEANCVQFISINCFIIKKSHRLREKAPDVVFKLLVLST